jgi:hypothetical protein
MCARSSAWIECLTTNQKVAGSNPAGHAIIVFSKVKFKRKSKFSLFLNYYFSVPVAQLDRAADS